MEVRLIADIQPTGAQVVLAPDSEFAASRAAAEGLISARDLESARFDKSQDERAPDPWAE